MKARFTVAVLCLVTAGMTPGISAAEPGKRSDGLYKNDTINSTANEIMEKPTEAEQ